MKVGFQGEMGAYSEAMARILYPGCEPIPCKTFKAVFEGVESGKTDAGAIPVENSLTGKINEPTTLLVASDLKACKEGMLRINHCLIAQDGVKLEDLKRVYGHPEALAQCRKLSTHMAGCEFMSWYDGAGAAKLVKADREAGVVASERVAELYGLKVLKRGVQDNPENATRFVAIAKESAPQSGEDKTTLVFWVKNEPGSLLRALECFAVNGVNLTRLESSPSREKNWEYLFIADLEGHELDENPAAALRALKRNTTSVKILGSYPKGKLHG